MDEVQKRIMVLGGGMNQVPLIDMAKKSGYYTLVCDMRNDVKGVRIADEHLTIDYMDKEAVLIAAQDKQIDGIISNSEPAMLSVAYVSQELCLPGNSVNSIKTLLSKELFRDLQKKIGVFSPAHITVSTFDELLGKISGLKYPLVMKPTESSGTRGITKISGYAESILKQVYDTCKKYSRNGFVTVEEYVEIKNSHVIGAEVFVIGSDVIWDGFYHQNRSAKIPLVPSAEIFPAALSEDEIEMAKDAIYKILNAAEIKLGEYNIELYFTFEHQVFIIEMNPRQGGNNLPLLVREYCGIDLTRLLVTTAVGELNYYEELKNVKRITNYITQQVIFAWKDGIYDGIEIHPYIAPYVLWVKEEYMTGDQIEKSRNAGDAVAFVNLKFDTHEVQQRYADDLNRFIYARIK